MTACMASYNIPQNVDKFHTVQPLKIKLFVLLYIEISCINSIIMIQVESSLGLIRVCRFNWHKLRLNGIKWTFWKRCGHTYVAKFELSKRWCGHGELYVRILNTLTHGSSFIIRRFFVRNYWVTIIEGRVKKNSC